MIRHLMSLIVVASLLVGAHATFAQGPVETPVVETDPAVRAAVELPRTKPSHYLSAVLALCNLKRPELAKPILDELQGLNLNDDQRADLVDEFGSPRMLQLARIQALAPAGEEFAESCMAAAAARYGLPTTGDADARVAGETADSGAELRRLQSLLNTGDAAALDAALADAMKQNRIAAAVALAEAVGQSGDASVLYANSPRPAPLADALVYPDLQVRLAALKAIEALDPKTPYPGSSRLPKTLDYLATAAGERRAVVLMPVADHATTLAGRLVGMGIVADPAVRGGPAMRLAQQSADLEFVLVDFDIHSPGIRDMLYALRTDPATGRIPIGLLATSDRLAAARRLAAEHSRVIAFPRPQSDDRVAQIVERLSRLSADDRLSPEERAAMGEQVRGWAEAHSEPSTTQP